MRDYPLRTLTPPGVRCLWSSRGRANILGYRRIQRIDVVQFSPSYDSSTSGLVYHCCQEKVVSREKPLNDGGKFRLINCLLACIQTAILAHPLCTISL